MVRHHLNLQFYAKCRFELKVDNEKIQNEIKQLFGDKFASPSLNTTISWSLIYRKEKNSLKKINLDFNKKFNDKMRFNIDLTQPNPIQKVQFYSLCRYELGINPQAVITETNLLFKNSLDLATFNKWILNLYKQDFNVQPIEIEKIKKVVETDSQLRNLQIPLVRLGSILRMNSNKIATISSQSDIDQSQEEETTLNESTFNMTEEQVLETKEDNVVGLSKNSEDLEENSVETDVLNSNKEEAKDQTEEINALKQSNQQLLKEIEESKQRMYELEDKVAYLTNYCEDYESESMKRNSIVNSEVIAEYETKIQNQTFEIDALKQDFEKLISAEISKTENLELEIKKLKQAKESIENNYMKLTLEIIKQGEEAKTLVANHKLACDYSEQTKKRLETICNSQIIQINNLENVFNSQSSQMASLKSLCSTQFNRNVNFENVCNSQANQIAAFKTVCNTQYNQIVNLEKVCNSQVDQLCCLKAFCNTQLNQIASLEVELTNLKNENSFINNSTDLLNIDFNTIDQEALDSIDIDELLKVDVCNPISYNDQITILKEEHELEIKDLNTRIQFYIQERNELSSKIDCIQNEKSSPIEASLESKIYFEEIKTAVLNNDKQVKFYRLEIHDLKAELKAACFLNKKQKKRIEDAQRQHALQKLDYADLEKYIDELKDIEISYSKLNKRYQLLETDYLKMRSSFKESSDNLDIIKHKYAKLKEKNKKYSADLDGAKTELKSKSNELYKLKTENHLLKDQYVKFLQDPTGAKYSNKIYCDFQADKCFKSSSISDSPISRRSSSQPRSNSFKRKLSEDFQLSDSSYSKIAKM